MLQSRLALHRKPCAIVIVFFATLVSISAVPAGATGGDDVVDLPLPPVDAGNGEDTRELELEPDGMTSGPSIPELIRRLFRALLGDRGAHAAAA